MTQQPDNIDDNDDDEFRLSERQCGKIAGQRARATTAAIAEKAGLSVERLLNKLAALVDAKLNKAQYSKDLQGFAYSKDMADNSTQLNAVKVAMDLLDLMPDKRSDITVNADEDLMSAVAMILSGDTSIE